MTYRITKVNYITEKEQNYGGGYTAEDVKSITKGYHFNGCFYNRVGSKYFYIVEEEN